MEWLSVWEASSCPAARAPCTVAQSAVLRPWARLAVNQVALGRQPLGLRALVASSVRLWTSSQLLASRPSSTEKLQAHGERRQRAAAGGGSASGG